MFALDVGTAIQSDGRPFGIGQYDFDHDGQIDMMYSTMKFGIRFFAFSSSMHRVP